MIHHKCGARCSAYDGCSVCVCPSVPYESGNYNLKCVSLRVDENGVVEYKKKRREAPPYTGQLLAVGTENHLFRILRESSAIHSRRAGCIYLIFDERLCD